MYTDIHTFVHTSWVQDPGSWLQRSVSLVSLDPLSVSPGSLLDVPCSLGASWVALGCTLGASR